MNHSPTSSSKVGKANRNGVTLRSTWRSPSIRCGVLENRAADLGLRDEALQLFGPVEDDDETPFEPGALVLDQEKLLAVE